LAAGKRVGATHPAVLIGRLRLGPDPPVGGRLAPAGRGSEALS